VAEEDNSMSSTWTFQKPEDVRRFGEEGANWYAGWYEPSGNRKKKSFGKGKTGKERAEKHAHVVEDQLKRGTYESFLNKNWTEFRQRYEEEVLTGLAARSRETALVSLVHFERIVKPKKVSVINANTISKFVAQRRKESGRRKGEPISPASINKDLRHIKAALSQAHEWKYLPSFFRIKMERVGKKIPRYITGEHFAAVYKTCDVATMPELPNVNPADWWRALLVLGYLTGWRISDMLNLRRDDLDLDAGTAIIRSEAEGNKDKNETLFHFHPLVVEHLRKIVTFTPFVLTWPHHRRTLDEEYLKIQQVAGINLPCRKNHEHTPHCHAYGFHDLRRAFATMNADNLTPEALQALMRHKSYQTTLVYINTAKQIKKAVEGLHVPDVLKGKAEPKEKIG
jgi:integrase